MHRLYIFCFFFIAFFIYSFFVYTKGTEQPATIKITNEVRTGKLLFQKLNCIACHQLYGLGGYLGPELTTVISQKTKGESYARVFLKNGTRQMPDFKLSDHDIDCLISYLSYIDITATTYKVYTY
jgi:nitric oxide reductase subunit C